MNLYIIFNILFRLALKKLNLEMTISPIIL